MKNAVLNKIDSLLAERPGMALMTLLNKIFCDDPPVEATDYEILDRLEHATLADVEENYRKYIGAVREASALLDAWKLEEADRAISALEAKLPYNRNVMSLRATYCLLKAD